MAIITLKPSLAKLLISTRESEHSDESYEYLENEIQKDRWNNIPAIWITPNFLLNGLLNGLRGSKWCPTFKPFIIYNGHHRFEEALKYNIPIKDRKSTRLNSSHLVISYSLFLL